MKKKRKEQRREDRGAHNSLEWLHHRGITRVTRGFGAANELEPQFLFGNTCEDISFSAFPSRHAFLSFTFSFSFILFFSGHVFWLLCCRNPHEYVSTRCDGVPRKIQPGSKDTYPSWPGLAWLGQSSNLLGC